MAANPIVDEKFEEMIQLVDLYDRAMGVALRGAASLKVQYKDIFTAGYNAATKAAVPLPFGTEKGQWGSEDGITPTKLEEPT